jgi:solute carrier family 25 oxoglutarate transporter 11
MFTAITGSDSKLINIASSFSAAAVSCVITLPFDNVKTKFQRMMPDANGKMPYSGFFNCFQKSIADEGFMGLYVGFGTFVVRISPHVVITLLATDAMHYMFSR